MSKKVKDSGSILPLNYQMIGSLNRALASELCSFWMYEKAIKFVYGPCSTGVDQLLRKVADEEMIDHAESLLKRIYELGGVPTVDLSSAEALVPHLLVRPDYSAKSYMVASAITERLAAEMYADMICQATELGDTTTKNVLEHILSDEEMHSTEFCRVLESVFVDEEKQFITFPLYPIIVVLVKLQGKVEIVGYFNNTEYYEFREVPSVVKGEFEEFRSSLQSTFTDDYQEVGPASLLNICTECGTHQIEPGVTVISTGDECAVTCDQDSIVCDSRDIETIIDHIIKHRKDKMNLKAIKDDLQDREVNGQVIKTKQFKTAEEANKFLEANKGYSLVDQDDQGVYVTLESQVKK